MQLRIRRLAGVTGGALLLMYSGAVGLLAFSETAMVFVSAGKRLAMRAVPPDNSGLKWDTLRVRDAEGTPVLLLESRLEHAMFRPWAIYFHGNAGFVGSRGNVERYHLLREAGFNVVAVEYRGYGASARLGAPSEEGVYRDARAAWRHVTGSLGIDPSRVVLYGWSLGSGAATMLAAEERPAALITEGAFTSLPDIGAAMYPWVPVRLIMRNKFDNLERASRLSVPWLLFHSRNDDVVPFAHGQALAAAASHIRFVQLTAGHEDGVLADREVALAALRTLARQFAMPLASGGRDSRSHPAAYNRLAAELTRSSPPLR